MCCLRYRSQQRSNMEESSKVVEPMSKDILKSKKPRTEKQMEAFKRCVEKRKQKFLDRKSQSVPKPIPEYQHQPPHQPQSLPQSQPQHQVEAQVTDRNEIKSLAEQIALLKNQLVDMKQEKDREKVMKSKIVPMSSIDEEAMDVDDNYNVTGPNISSYVDQQRSRPLVQQVRFEPKRGMDFGYVANGPVPSRKRDIRGMDPYVDEKRGMMEKIYARNVNVMRQQQMDALNSNRMSDENSVQLLSSNSAYPNMDEYGERVNNDRQAPVDKMVDMIRSSSFTSNARKQTALAFNGVRMASRR
jgi:hypothetical protein